MVVAVAITADSATLLDDMEAYLVQAGSAAK